MTKPKWYHYLLAAGSQDPENPSPRIHNPYEEASAYVNKDENRLRKIPEDQIEYEKKAAPVKAATAMAALSTPATAASVATYGWVPTLMSEGLGVVGATALGKLGEIGDKKFGTRWMEPTGTILGGFTGGASGITGARQLLKYTPQWFAKLKPIRNNLFSEKFLTDTMADIFSSNVKGVSTNDVRNYSLDKFIRQYTDTGTGIRGEHGASVIIDKKSPEHIARLKASAEKHGVELPPHSTLVERQISADPDFVTVTPNVIGKQDKTHAHFTSLGLSPDTESSAQYKATWLLQGSNFYNTKTTAVSTPRRESIVIINGPEIGMERLPFGIKHETSFAPKKGIFVAENIIPPKAIKHIFEFDPISGTYFRVKSVDNTWLERYLLTHPKIIK